MTYRLLLKSTLFVAEGLLLMLLLTVVLHFEVAQLLFGIVVAAFCLFAEVFVVVRIGQRLWRWNGRLAALMVREDPTKAIPTATPTGTRGEA